jgi:uncharacterized membrane protein
VSTDIVEVASNGYVLEVLRTQDGWGLVGGGEVSGWVSMNFLTALPHTENEIPLPLYCYGAEPFWSIAIRDSDVNYSTPEMLKRPMEVESSALASNGFTFQLTEDAPYTHTLVARSSYCSDGMSDREFGVSALMHLQTDEGNYVHQGCCTFQTE